MPRTIGAVAKATSVSVQALRYYERRGLLSPAARSTAGYRLFAGDQVRRVFFIKRAQALGFTLDEIRDLLALRIKDGRRCESVRRVAQRTRDRVSERIVGLRQIERALDDLLVACEAGRSAGACPVLTAIEEEAG